MAFAGNDMGVDLLLAENTHHGVPDFHVPLTERFGRSAPAKAQVCARSLATRTPWKCCAGSARGPVSCRPGA